jgi:branched-chain amino acid transport system ATP-binding protein
MLLLAKINQQGIAVLLVEQNARAALKLAQNASVFELGKVVMEGKANMLLNDERIQAAYLGKHSA